MNPDQTAPVWSGTTLFSIKAAKGQKQKSKQTTIVPIGRKRVKINLDYLMFCSSINFLSKI